MELEKQKPKRTRQIHTDRIVLDADSMEVILAHSRKIDATFGGVVKLTSKQIVNFLLQNRPADFSAGELSKLKDEFFDDIQAAEWAIQRLKAAKVAGKELKLSEVLKEIQTPLVKEKRSLIRPKAKLEESRQERSRLEPGQVTGATGIAP